MLTAFLITLGAIGYLNIGYWWGHVLWWVWYKKEWFFISLLCFLMNHNDNTIGDKTCIVERPGPPILTAFKKEIDYKKTLALTWPLKVVFNLMPLSFLLVTNSLVLVTHPTSLLPKQSPKQLPPAEPDPDQLNPYEEHQRLLEKREEMNVRLKELEAHPDYEKTRAFPKRIGG